MNVSYMIKKWAKAAVRPLVFCAVFGLPAVSLGQAMDGDICSVEVTSHTKGTVVTAPGEQIKFLIRLGQSFAPIPEFQLNYIGGGSEVLGYYYQLKLKMSTGGWAYLDGVQQSTTAPGKYDCLFTYTVQEGDFAIPLTIAGDAGSSDPGNAYEFGNTNIWSITNTTTGEAVKWRVGQGVDLTAGDIEDWTMSKADIRIQTLAFDSAADYTVAVSETLNCTVKRPGTDTTQPVAFWVWPEDPNLFIVDGANEATGARSLSIPSGASEVNFTIRGVTATSPNKTYLYIGHTEGKPANGRVNYVAKGVIVTPAPDPTVKVALIGADAYSGILTVPESDDVAQTFKVSLSKPAESNMWVTLTTDPNYIKLAETKVLIGNGSSESDAVNFWALNNTASVSITPTIPGDTIYVITKPGIVKIGNLAPVIIEPTEDQRSVIALDELEINYSISDVDADDEVITQWDWGDMSGQLVTTGRVGTVKHVYNSIGVYSLKVRSRDPDNEYSVTRAIPINVTAGVPKPTISVICDTKNLTETPSNILSFVTVRLSELYTKGDLKYKLIVEQADTTTTNLLMQHAINETELTIPYGQLEGVTQSSFRIMDGTSNTEGMGVRITAVPTDPIASNYYARVSKLIMFQNTPPAIATPTMYQYTEPYPATVPREYTYSFRDHVADLDGIVSEWDFGDGSPKVTVTGASGSVNHTYKNAGVYTLNILVKDKDEIASGVYKDPETFVVNIGDPPSITVLPNEMTLMEYSTKNPQIQVELSSKFQYAVPVTLTVSPVNSAGAGRLILGVTQIEFKAGEVVKTVGILSDLDGTAASYSGAGFTVTPSITPGQPSTAEARDFFKTFNEATIRIQNEDPIISAPRASTSAQDILYELSQGIEKTFAYSIKDCPADSLTTGMTVTWNWGDGTPSTNTEGASGSAKHTYTSFGVYEIVMVARDKDGGWD